MSKKSFKITKTKSNIPENTLLDLKIAFIYGTFVIFKTVRYKQKFLHVNYSYVFKNYYTIYSPLKIYNKHQLDWHHYDIYKLQFLVYVIKSQSLFQFHQNLLQLL